VANRALERNVEPRKSRVYDVHMNLATLSDEELVQKLTTAYLQTRRLLAVQVEYLIEVERRRLHLDKACSTLFVFCCRRLGMSRSSASRMVCAVETVKRFPEVLERIARAEARRPGARRAHDLGEAPDVGTRAALGDAVPPRDDGERRRAREA
jgi:hypothetical protein